MDRQNHFCKDTYIYPLCSDAGAFCPDVNTTKKEQLQIIHTEQ